MKTNSLYARLFFIFFILFSVAFARAEEKAEFTGLYGPWHDPEIAVVSSLSAGEEERVLVLDNANTDPYIQNDIGVWDLKVESDVEKSKGVLQSFLFMPEPASSGCFAIGWFLLFFATDPHGHARYLYKLSTALRRA